MTLKNRRLETDFDKELKTVEIEFAKNVRLSEKIKKRQWDKGFMVSRIEGIKREIKKIKEKLQFKNLRNESLTRKLNEKLKNENSLNKDFF